MKQFGLIGYPLTHSFSKKYFTEKFDRAGITDCRYDLFELPDITTLPEVLKTPGLRGLNVTIPHKQAVLPYLDQLDSSAQKVGAVNVIRLETDGTCTGFNSDYYGFRQSLEEWFQHLNVNPNDLKALVLGTGGAAKAVTVVLTDLGIPYRMVSRTPSTNGLTYSDLPNVVSEYRLIINTSPVGTYPHTDQCPNLPYEQLTGQHLLYDLIYNPAETLFMQKGRERGAATHNGHRMLVLQAEKSWEIWNS